MRKLLYLLLIFSAFCFQSCLKEDEDLFDKSASERMSSTLEAYKSTLVASEYGWSLEYYPEEDQSYGGFMYAIKFTEDDATVAIDLEGSSLVETSLYKLVGDNGPVLTFDTFNLPLHFFSNPSEDSPEGFRGDYEFILMKQENDVITLKGKKTGNIMVLTKLREPFNDFIDKVKSFSNLFDAVPNVVFSIGETSITYKKQGRVFVFLHIEGGTEKLTTVAYVPSTSGIKLYKPITINGETFQEFKFNEDKLGMTCTTNSKVKFTFIYPPLNALISETKKQWTFKLDGSNMSADLAQVFAKEIAWNTKVYKETVSIIALGVNPIPKSDKVNQFTFFFKSDKYKITHGYLMTPVPNTKDQVDIKLTKPGFNWEFYDWFLSPIKFIADHSPYRMTSDDDKNPSYVKFESVANPNIWFRVDKLEE